MLKTPGGMPRGWGRAATKERGWRERASASGEKFRKLKRHTGYNKLNHFMEIKSTLACRHSNRDRDPSGGHKQIRNTVAKIPFLIVPLIHPEWARPTCLQAR